MQWLISMALQFRVLIVALALGMMAYGIQTAEQIPLDVFPEFAPPLVEIQTEVPGATAEEVESLVSVPIESSLNGIPFVDTIRSKSVPGLSAVRLIFQPNTDLIIARQLVQERLSLATARLPKAARQPVILPPLSSLSRAMKIGLTSTELSQMDLTVLCKWTIRPRLMAVEGVANVAIWGEYDRQFQVLVDPERLRAHDLTLGQVEAAVRQSAAVGSGGFVDVSVQRLALRQAPAVETPDDLADTVVQWRNGAPLRLGDVAEVQIGSPPPIGDAVINSVKGIMLIVEKQPWANTLDVTRGVEQAMNELAPALPNVHVDTTIFRPATFIERALRNLTRSLIEGCVLVIVVLCLFLFDWRAALISSLAIPLSLLAAVLLLYFRGGTINTMVLAGLLIALGEVVDDAIIDVENIQRRLRLNSLLPEPRSMFQVVLEASMEVRSAVVYASVIVVLTLIPVFFLDGLAGSFFRPLAASYVLAILASLAVALTVTPALALLLLPAVAGTPRDAPLVRLLKSIYGAILPFFVRHPGFCAGLVLAIFCGAGLAVQDLGEELLPRFRETDFLMHWVEKPGIGIEPMNRISILASREMMNVPGVRNFGAHIGRAEVADEVVGANFTELWISIDEDADYDKTVAHVQEIVDGYPGLYRDLLTYLTERIKEVLSGASGSVVVRIFGPDLSDLRQQAEAVREVMARVPGVAGLKVEQQVLVPQIVVRVRNQDALSVGLSPGDILAATATLINGTQVGEVFEDQKIFRIVVQGEARLRRDVEAIRGLLIDAPSGAQVALRDVADITVESGPNVINRESASRKIDVYCNVAGRDLSSVARELEAAVRRDVTFLPGCHPQFLGEYAEASAARQRLFLLSGLSAVAIFLLLYSDFQAFKPAALIFLTLPFALAGGIAGVVLGGGVVSLGSLVGFVTVLGVAVRNGIMLIDHYRHLQQVEGVPFGIPLILQGASERLAPVLMTAMTTGLALIPVLQGGNIPGQEIEYPMAFVILGGLLSSTLLNLLVVPAFYFRVMRPSR
jgi:CzcA family heavy metal efflux pump